MASDAGSEGSTSLTRRGSVGLAVATQNGDTWSRGGLLKGSDQTAMAAVVAAAAIAIQAVLKSRKEIAASGGQLGSLQSFEEDHQRRRSCATEAESPC